MKLIIDIVITIIESFLLSWFIVTVSRINNQTKIIIILTSLFSLETILCNNVYTSNALLLIIEVLSSVVILYYYSKLFRFSYIVITGYGIGIILISNILALIMISSLVGESLYTVTKSVINFSLIVSLSKIISMVIYAISIKVISSRQSQLKLSNWWLFGVFLGIILLMMIVIGETLVYQNFNYLTLQVVLVGLIVLLILSFLIYQKINNENNMRLELAKEVIKNDYANKNYKRINYLYDRTINDRHRMMYVLLSIDDLVKNKKYDQACSLLNQEIQESKKFSISYLSSNPYFDYRIQEKISQLKQNNYDIKTIFQIKQISILANESLIDDIINSIDLVAKAIDADKRLSIYITQSKLYLVIKLVGSKRKRNVRFIKKSDLIKKVDLSYDDKTITLKMLIDIK